MTILLFAIVLAVLILSHELGHFLFAKLSGTKVEEFGLGFPPRIFGIKKGGTIYSLNWIPFGGFVKILGEDDTEKKSGSFSSKPIYVRAAILVAGVFFNLILAWVLFSFAYLIGAPTSVDGDTPGAITIIDVQKDSAAEAVGLMPGDKLKKLSFLNETLEVETITGVQEFVKIHRGQEIQLEYFRGEELLVASAVPEPILGVAMDRIGIVSLPFHKAVWEGTKDTVFLTIIIVKLFGLLIAELFGGGGALASQVSGPIGIVGMVGSAAKFGLVYIVQFVALFSVNLAILNMIPFPALDGGRLLFLAIEAIKGSPINQKIQQQVNMIGFAILIGLMLLVTFRDIVRIFN